ncbi:MAG: peroxidase family protein [Acidobacteriota bacterium]
MNRAPLVSLFAARALAACGLLLAASAVAQTCDPAERAFDGFCNNLAQPALGATDDFLGRGAEGVIYADGVSEPVLEDRANERTVSNVLLASPDTGPLSEARQNIFSTFFGQFISHDLSLQKTIEDEPGEPVTLDSGSFVFFEDPSDPFLFFPLFPPTPFAGLPKASVNPDFVPGVLVRLVEGEIVDLGQGARFEVANRVSHFLDGSQVYGSTQAVADALRSFQGGRLLVEDYLVSFDSLVPPGVPAPPPVALQNYLPSAATTGAPIDVGPSGDQPLTEFLSAGDIRSSENISLALMHLIFVREHNRRADLLAAENPGWSDEQLYQAARTWVVAHLQHIIYHEFLPSLIGPLRTFIGLGPYFGYDPSVDPRTGQVFTSAAFRYGHTTVTGSIPLVDACGAPVPNAGFSQTTFQFGGGALENAGQTGAPFTVVTQAGLTQDTENLLRGLIFHRNGAFDTKVTPALRDINVPSLDVSGVDVPVFTMRRGRLNGIPGYSAVREAYFPIPGLGRIYGTFGCDADESTPSPDPLVCFQALTGGDVARAETLRDLYGKLTAIDPWAGMVSEPRLPGSGLGRTMAWVILEQFRRSRAGDRFWYQSLPSSVFGPLDKLEVATTSLADILRRNFAAGLEVPDNVFLTPPESFFAGCP